MTGLFEAHLPVSDLGRAVDFYRDVVGLELGFESSELGAAFLWIEEPGRSMLGLWAVGHAPLSLSLHVAFGTDVDGVFGAFDRLREIGVTPLSFFAIEADEPSVIAWMPAASVYFRDADGHLLEYLAMLESEPRPDLGILTWSRWQTVAAAPGARACPYSIDWYQGPRSDLRHLFDLADDSPERIDGYIELGRALVARDDRGEIVGHLQLVPEAATGALEIKSLAVVPRLRRRGIGRRLMDRAVATSRAERIRSLSVTTAMADIDNLRFYQRGGFRATSIAQDAFVPENGYPATPAVDGIPLRDAIRFELVLGER